MSNYMSEKLEPPKWMDKEFMLTVLKNCETDEDIEIIDVKFTPGSEKGDNYASIMLRATVDYRTSKGSKSKSMVIKILPDNEIGEILKKTKFFDTEIKMYFEILPKMEAELRRYGDDTKLGAKLLYCSLSPRKVIVFEDLCSEGYYPVRGRFLNMTETKEILLLLAKWHAVSFKLASEGDESIKTCDQGLFNSIDAEKSPFLSNGIKYLTESLATVDGYEVYADKLRALAPTLLKNCLKIFNAHRLGDKQSIMVLNHGDFHMKNVMFKYNGDKLENALLVDFQLCTYAPSSIDIIYGTYTSFSPEIRQEHREELTYYYFEIFLETLRRIEYIGVPPTLADFNIDLIRNRDFEIFVVATFQIMWLNMVQPVPGLDTSQILRAPDSHAKSYQHPLYVKELQQLLPRFLHRGYLEKQ